MDRVRIFAALALLAMVVAGRARAESAGADCGKGLLLFSVAADESSASPPYLKQIEADGWKVETRVIEPNYQREGQFADALRRRIESARSQGCQRIALAGESFGAWLSLLANATFQTPPDSTRLQAVIAIDASAAKAKAPRDGWHDYKFINLLKAQNPTQLALFLYDAPADEADDRRDEVSHSLTNQVRGAQVIVETAAFDGADGPRGEAFARRYGPRLIEMLDGAVNGNAPAPQ